MNEPTFRSFCLDYESDYDKKPNAFEIWKYMQQQLTEAQALIAMQAEALNRLLGVNSNDSLYQAIEELRRVDFASSETVATWEDSKLKPLQQQVAMLHHLLVEHITGFPLTTTLNGRSLKAIEDTQAVAEAHDREVERRGAAKVLEECANKVETISKWWAGNCAEYMRNQADQIRAAKNGGAE